ncbi:hypothetical protein DFJ58DRAFT_723230 [Suillus subalutaceus]|uniref:uncharacterized protein n=1 Tax=Suillus subalutaceus TaxID=48586 RepID=UPI001B87A78A|nr:uncharacterized protein DFJ58DRAFT_723230 [Suillus subalutaceus]KAG1869382.1 hypothetical protein DFJ58DRAFT_723230 [Suillus subalutaceus]
MAWADLMISYPADSFVADVDLECLITLEAMMFEDSEAGPAGNRQWGLDAGQLHRKYNVYLNIPTEWVLGRDHSESELEEMKGAAAAAIDDGGVYNVSSTCLCALDL